MIYTCTTNPSLDYYLTIDKVTEGINNRSNFEMYDAGGKGVNVSIVLNNFHIPSVALGFLGGFTKDYYLKFISRFPNIQPLFTSIKDNTRINIKIMEEGKETGLNAKGPNILDEEFNKFKDRLSRVYEDDIFILSGNIEEEIKDRIIECVKDLCKQGTKVILDTDYDVIERCLGFNIFMIKLNNNHIKASDKSIDELMKHYISNNVENVMYSSKNESSYLYTTNNKYLCKNLADSLVNITGSSDSMVAGFIYSHIRGGDDFESFRYANAASIATSMSNDLGSKEKIESIYDSIEVVKL